MGILKNVDSFGWKIIHEIEVLDRDRQRKYVDLEWFGIEISWFDDEALFSGDLRVKIWNDCCLHERERKILISPFRSRLDDEDLVQEISE